MKKRFLIPLAALIFAIVVWAAPFPNVVYDQATKIVTVSGLIMSNLVARVGFTSEGAFTAPSGTITNTLASGTLTEGGSAVPNSTDNLGFFASTTSSQLRGVLSDESGTGEAVFSTSPTLVTPNIGVATATSVNKITLTAPATGATVTILDGKTFTVNKTLTLDGTDGTTLTFQSTGTVVNRDSTDTFTNKTLDSQATGNVLKFLDYRDFVYPHRVDGVGATITTNDYTSALSGLATYAGSGGTNANYAIFRVGTVPLDLDTGTTMNLRNLAFRVSGTDTNSASFSVGYYSAASSSAFSPSDFTALAGYINATTGTLTSPVANDIFYFSDITLTGWASGLTAGRQLVIGIARNGTDANNDSITIVGGTIEFGRTQ